MAQQKIVLNNVRENNLKNFTLSLPRRSIIAFVGVSGSGKSSLLFNTLAAESLSRHEAITTNAARKSFARRPDVDAIEGLPFCTAVSQRSLHRSPRSTIATLTGLHDALRSLYISYPEIWCSCGKEVLAPDASSLTKFLKVNFPSCIVTIGGVIGRSQQTGFQKEIKSLKADGFKSVLVKNEDAAEYSDRKLSNLRSLNSENRNTLTVPLGQFHLGKDSQQALEHLLTEAIRLGGGDVYLNVRSKKKPENRIIETGLVWPCPSCQKLHDLPTSPLLSFNSDETRSGKCRDCDGIGSVKSVDLNALVPDTRKSIEQGCFELLRERGSYKYLSIREDVVRGLCQEHGQKTKTAYRALPNALVGELLNGAGKRRVLPIDGTGEKSGPKVLFHGFIATLMKLSYTEGTAGDYARSYVTEVMCESCNGTRFDNSRVDCYQFRKFSFTDILSQTSLAASELFQELAPSVEKDQYKKLSIINQTLEALVRSGLGYLRLDRATSTLSGGELQRLKIAGSFCSGLTNCCYILDEPSLGLHATDNLGMIQTITKLRDKGNTILLAEHDPDFSRSADLIVELGPSGGPNGGEVVSIQERTPKSQNKKNSKFRRESTTLRGSIALKGCTANNLKNITVEVPLGGLICVTGISGSGKSSFAHKVLYPAITAYLNSGRTSGPTWKDLEQEQTITAISRLGQQSIGVSSISLVATYLGIFDRIRNLFAESAVAQTRNYSPSHFSHNRPEGRCTVCNGKGFVAQSAKSVQQIECPACGGSRFADAILDVRLNDLTISDVLQMDINGAITFFAEDAKIIPPLNLLIDFGLGHLQLGRPTVTLSGGEAQRLKLSLALSQLGGAPEGLVFILDEPTAGLHHKDVKALVDRFDRIIDGGKNTLIVIEHDLEIVGISDHIIDFGPGAGEEGGQVVYAGPPNGASLVKASKTGEALSSKQSRALPDASSKSNDEVVTRGISISSEIPHQLIQQANQFLQRVRNEEMEEALDEEAILLPPTYILAHNSSCFPIAKRTVMENLRISDLLFKAISDLVDSPEQKGVRRICSIDEALQTCRQLAPESIVAFSPIPELLESKCATRSALRDALIQASERGFTQYIDSSGQLSSLDNFRKGEEAALTAFDTRVVLGPIGRSKKSDREIIAAGLEVGGGWLSLHQVKPKTRQEKVSLIGHISDRPLDIEKEQVGRRRCTPGLFDRNEAGECPFCRGSGTLAEIDLSLVVADRSKSPCDLKFYHQDCRLLLKAIWKRLTATLTFLDTEGLAKLTKARARWSSSDWEILVQGYPWGRFIIPGRSGKKNIDYYEFSGLVPLVLDRLHLSTRKKWASRVETSQSETKCFYCESTGFDWLARHYRLGDHSVANWFTDRTHGELRDYIARFPNVGRCGVLVKLLDQLVSIGLGGVKIGSTCNELSNEDRRRVRSLAICQLATAEATYCIDGPAKDNPLYPAEIKLMQKAASDCKVVFLENT
jgi:excinuclease ABC subunit A